MLICIDPGHGGLDGGACGNGIVEKYVNLLVASLTKNLLCDVYSIHAELTHLGQGFGGNPYSKKRDLDRRVTLANEAKADYFISIHTNSSTNPTANGTEVYICGKGGEAEKLANSILKPLVRTMQTKNRGVRLGNFQVLRETKMPAVLVELAYLSNLDDAMKLVNPYFLERAAAGIAWGVNCYIKGFPSS